MQKDHDSDINFLPKTRMRKSTINVENICEIFDKSEKCSLNSSHMTEGESIYL